MVGAFYNPKVPHTTLFKLLHYHYTLRVVISMASGSVGGIERESCCIPLIPIWNLYEE